MDYFDILFAKTNGISEGTCYNEIEAMLEATVGHSSKNLLDIDGFDDTLYNVHGYCENGYFRIVGTYQSDGVHQFFRIFFNLPAGSYILSGAPDYNTTSIRIAMCTYDSSPSNYSTIGYDQGENLSFTLNKDSKCFIAFRFQSGAIGVPIDLTLPVMLRSGSISDNTFDPYVMPTDEKKQDKPIVLWEAALNSTGVSDVPISSLADDVSNYPYLKVVVTNEGETTITDQDAVMTTAEYDTAYIGREVAVSVAMLGKHLENGVLVFDRLFIWVYSEGTNISVRGLRNHNDTSTPPDVVPGVFIRKIIGIPK